MERSNEWVEIAFSRETVSIPWLSRQALLDRMRHLESAAALVAAFEAVGTSRPVVLDAGGKADLFEIIRFWVSEVGVDELPSRIADLRHALLDDIAADPS